ncbi:hypothetical protein CPB85DRAFT_1255030 [Mucidula mucida]|nr:hypothetical protein CPB85DRAFT_1255030 [Mucidula mucida]
MSVYGTYRSSPPALMPTTRSKLPVFREKVFGFPLSYELVRQRPEFKSIVDKHPEVTEQDRRGFERQLCRSIMGVMALHMQEFWHRARLQKIPSGLVISLANNRNIDTSTIPSPEVIERMQREMKLAETVQPIWMNA